MPAPFAFAPVVLHPRCGFGRVKLAGRLNPKSLSPFTAPASTLLDEAQPQRREGVLLCSYAVFANTAAPSQKKARFGRLVVAAAPPSSSSSCAAAAAAAASSLAGRCSSSAWCCSGPRSLSPPTARSIVSVAVRPRPAWAERGGHRWCCAADQSLPPTRLTTHHHPAAAIYYWPIAQTCGAQRKNVKAQQRRTRVDP